MNYLLDTCVLSELVRPKPNTGLTEWLVSIPPDTAFLSVLTIGELRKGIEKLPNSKKKNRLALWYSALLNDYQDRIIPIDLGAVSPVSRFSESILSIKSISWKWHSIRTF